MKLQGLTKPATSMLHTLDQEPSPARDLLLKWESADPTHRVVRVVRGDKATTKASFFLEIAAALQFPPYFGENFDALRDCLADISWLPGEALVILVTNAEHLLDKASPDELTIALKTLAQAAHELAKSKKGPRSLHVVAQSKSLDIVTKRWHASGLTLTPLS